MGSKVTELKTEVINIRKEMDRRHEAQVEKNLVYDKVIGEVKQHDIKQDARLNDLEAEVNNFKDQVSSGSRAEK